MIQVSNGKVFNIRVVNLDLTFPKTLISSILDNIWMVCAWLEHGIIIWQNQNFKQLYTFSLHSKLISDSFTLDYGPKRVTSWACTRPCKHASSIAKFNNFSSVQISLSNAINTGPWSSFQGDLARHLCPLIEALTIQRKT